MFVCKIYFLSLQCKEITNKTSRAQDENTAQQ
ncbi:hypothetical protein [Porphyromonas phage phage005b_ATCC49417]|uniref:Uncharacterized protein n=1 Tax=Porphyromonas phage phage005a_ATCC49417 TaxID=3154097 RepID=A0AAT9JB26_9VIRU